MAEERTDLGIEGDGDDEWLLDMKAKLLVLLLPSARLLADAARATTVEDCECPHAQRDYAGAF